MDFPGTFKSSIVPPGTSQPSNGKGPRGYALGRSLSITPTIKHARQRHKMVVMLALSGHTNNEIALAMGYTPGRISTILASQHPELLQVREEAASRVMDHMTDPMLRFRAEVPKSIDTLVTVRDSCEDMGQRRLAARDILDRAGYSPVRKQLTVNADLPPAQLAEALGRVEEVFEIKSRQHEWAVTTIDKDQ